MTIQIFIHFLDFINNFSVIGASTFLILFSILHNWSGITKILKQTINLFMKNLQNKTFSYVLTLKMGVKRGMKWRLVIIVMIHLYLKEDKLSIHFQKLRKKKVFKGIQRHSSILALLDHDFLKSMCNLYFEKIIISFKVNMPPFWIDFEKRFPGYNFLWCLLN